jgi:alpha-galactosidase
MSDFQQLYQWRSVLLLMLALCGVLSPTLNGQDQRPGVPRKAGQPLKVFILAGQSNMEGHAHLKTLEHLAMQDETKPMLAAIQNPDGTPKVHEQVWISYLSGNGVKQGQLTTGYGANAEKLGPELTFGIYLQQTLGEPILIIKTAWGGKSLHTDFRPPSAGPFQFREEQLEQFRKEGKDVAKIQAEKAEATGANYRLMLEHVQKVLSNIKDVYPNYNEQAGYRLTGFVWLQGWNDMVDGGVYPNRDKPGGYDAYSVNLAHFIRDVRRDLDSPELPFVIGVMGVGGPTAEYGPAERRYQTVHQNFRDAMAAPAKLTEFEGNVVAVLTENYWDQELTALRTREAAARDLAKKQAKEQQLAESAAKQLENDLRTKEFTPRELETLEKGISNAEFHYLGSARILGGIGKGFAEAMAELLRQQAAGK